ncbi:hypothetical protein [Corynebacterium glutamicum]|nr:hypothetical protein [Corynebacterium glutamicum]
MSDQELPPVPEDQMLGMTEFFNIGKSLAGDRLPAITKENVEAWARVLPEICVLSKSSMQKVLTRWSREGTTQRMATPKDIRDALVAEKKAWQQSPQGRAWHREHQRRMEDLRDQQLRDGTFRELRYAGRQALEAPPKSNEKINSLIQQAYKKIENGKGVVHGDR